MARKPKDSEESAEKAVPEEVEEEPVSDSSEMDSSNAEIDSSNARVDSGAVPMDSGARSEPSVTPEPAPIPQPPSAPASWGRVTETPVVPPPPPLAPAPTMDSAPESNPVVVAEATKPEPEQEAAGEVQSSEAARRTAPGRRVQPPGIIGSTVRGGGPGSPGRSE